MTPQELFSRTPVQVSNEIEGFHSHLGDYGISQFEFNKVLEEDPNIETRFYAVANFDGYRYWMLGAVFFRGIPVLIFQEAGRNGRDHTRNIEVRDPENPNAMGDFLRYIRDNLLENGRVEAVSLDTDVEDLDYFYNCKLDDIVAEYHTPKDSSP